MSKRARRNLNKRNRHLRTGAARAEKTLASEWPDPRAIAAGVAAVGGVPVGEETAAIVVEPIRLATGAAIYFQSPHVAPMYLLKARKLRDGAEGKRLHALDKTITTPDGTLRPRDPRAAFDAIEDLALAVVLAASAIESYANDAIGRLPDDTMVQVPTRLAGETVIVMRDKSAMDRMPIAEKVARVVPLLTGRDSIKGSQAWQAFRRVNRIRNGLVHHTRGAYNDPDRPSPFGLLMLGQGSTAPEDAAAVIEALEPGWLPEHVRTALG